MKILCVIDSLGSGGAQRQLVELAKGFKEKGHEVSLLVYHEENFFKSILDEVKIPIEAVIEKNYVKRLFKMRNYIRKGNFDAVLSFLEAANFICEIAGLPWRKWKLVVGERSANPGIFKSFKLRFYRWSHLFADYVVANSNENLKIVRKINPFLSKKKCKVINNIVEFEVWEPVVNYVPFKNGKLNLVVASSHQYLKNAKGLINAINHLTAHDKLRIKVDWYGDESPDNSFNESIALVQKYALQDIFTFYKATRYIVQKMQYADVIGLFSFYEGLPNVICEGMVLGKPIISSSVSDVPKLLNNDRNFLFNPNNIEDINRVLLYLLSVPKEELLSTGEINRKKAYSLFAQNKIVSNYLTLLN